MAEAVKTDPNVAEELAATRETLDQMLRVMTAQLHLQRVALLEDGHILRFNAPNMQRIAMSLPDAVDDFVQGVIVQTRGFYEAKILAKVAEMGVVGPKSVVCDVGANIGNHTVYFASIMGAAKVIAFEPQAHCHATLQANIALNGLEKRVVTHHSLVGAEAGQGQMVQFNTRNLGGTSFEVAAHGGVPMTTLDMVLTKADVAKLDLIKIDVEGMQIPVLQGAVGILEQRKPALWVELLQRDDAFEETAAFLAGFGYVAEKLARNDFLFRAA
ncbi:FkbM family methyltransferase [Pseudorhodobacter ferrugineus]|uniref:FkbM family methyltransferase n=1 Tax=Pseudorhodobacter ferrugineus TaxID=77008 RepID=UPI0003B62BA9|nr:FkbM family methyltransferase [Pseudorhodobacter ferrugineus]